jgi:serine/threonine-protein kinase
MSDQLLPGQIFAGRYRIEKFLAKGGFGAVYVAEQIETELRVALKVLWAHVLSSKDAVEKFKLEARVAGRVGSEHIVRVFDAGLDDATQMPFLVMELLAGEELEKVVESRGPLRPETLVAYFRQIASALDKAHGYVDKDGARRPIVHRDLKPENLFLCHRETGEPIVKILDFGIAKVLSDSTKVSQEVKGTPLYMAFEQASAGKITPQTDVWALGLIAFYLLTGRCYWKTANAADASLTQLFGEVLALPIDPPSQRAAELGAPVIPSAVFDSWFARCVNRDVAARFATAGESAAALATALLGAPDTRLSPGAFQAEAFAATAQAPSSAVAPPAAAAVSAPAVAAVSAYGATGVAPTTRSPEAAVANTANQLALGQTKAPETKTPGAVFIGLGAVVALGAAVAITLSVMRGGATVAPSAEPLVPAAQAPQPATPPPPRAEPTTTPVVANTAPVASAAPEPPASASAAPVATVVKVPQPGRPQSTPRPSTPRQTTTPQQPASSKTELYGER